MEHGYLWAAKALEQYGLLAITGEDDQLMTALGLWITWCIEKVYYPINLEEEA